MRLKSLLVIALAIFALAPLTRGKEEQTHERDPPFKRHLEFVREKVEGEGLEFESHGVATKDGHVLQVFHIYSAK